MDKILSKDGKCELVEKSLETIEPCKGCHYNKGLNGCVAVDSDVSICLDKDFNNEGTYIFKEIAKCQNTTA